ncbi:MAG: hypothetical protein V8P98_00965 [Acutalibacteraceae bacterium]
MWFLQVVIEVAIAINFYKKVMILLVSEMIDAVKNAEISAMDKQKMAKKQADLIIEDANKEAQSITKAKIKEAKAKADLRINFAKSSAEEAYKKNIKKCEENIRKLKEKSENMKAQTIKTVINLIVD